MCGFDRWCCSCRSWRPHIPRIPAYLTKGIGAGYVQEESSKYADIALERALDRGENVVIPRVGGTSIKTKLIPLLNSYGYKISLYYNDVPIQASIMRAMSRFAETGRYLSIDYLKDGIGPEGRFTNKAFSAFENIVAENENELYNIEWRDNNVDTKRDPVLIWDKNSTESLSDAVKRVGEYPSVRQSAGGSGRSASGSRRGQTEASALSQIHEAGADGEFQKSLSINSVSGKALLSQEDSKWQDASSQAQQERAELGDEYTRHSLRGEDPPIKTGIAYKVFLAKDGQLYPPMVANPGGAGTPVGVWLNADAAPISGTTKTGRLQVAAGGKGTSTGKQSLAYRPGWHLGEVPLAKQFARMDENGNKTLFPSNFVWAECEYAKDVDYQKEAMSYGYNENGKFVHSYAGLPKIPADGFYKYRTNPNPDTVPWIITGAMRVNRILTDAETDAILQQNNLDPMARKGGPIDLSAFGIDNPVTRDIVSSMQSIRRKSVNEFTAKDNIKAEPFARRYWKEMGVKSPFFRAWFGDWRSKDTTLLQISQGEGSESRKAGKAQNLDTKRVISWGSVFFRETAIHQRSGGIATAVSGSISDIVRNAILLDSFVSTPDSKTKMPNTVMMHHFYSVVTAGNQVHILKLYAEEALPNNSAEPFTRAYDLKDIKKVATLTNGVLSLSEGLTDASISTISTVSDLFGLVKQFDKDFKPRSVHPAFLNDDGTPKLMYHGTDSDFDTFDMSRGRANMDIQGAFFSPYQLDAKGYGKNVRAFYLSMQNPADESMAFISKTKRRNTFNGKSKAGSGKRKNRSGGREGV